MTDVGGMRSRITFQTRFDGETGWTDFISCSAYINGVSGSDFYSANMGYEAELAVNIICRWQPDLMYVVPRVYRVVDEHGIIYDITSPADDVGYRHDTVKIRAKRIYTYGGND